ncbi:aryl-alcohol dehydrogenase-like predicted oxidoreductase [Gramella sp. Hel_I_59]|uniref:aldo/keto reductase n=1 Tax=Gramella sp. Hel_I_59 TaxID=1249978 RepID=UPI00114FC98A|nr:aldo/keto reductase [Gramella sp. Hel_I_59]TQI70408.1 aryl-alcohol dehydrogenase-like predicted oxidoreductase [Gramella sp. Hel_I_59]
MKLSEKLGLGTVQFGLSYGISNNSGKTSEKEVQKILNFAETNNINILDSASAYGNAEEVLGTCDLGRFKIVSKFLPASLGITVDAQLANSLRNLKTETLYGYLAHRPMNLLDYPNEWEELQALKATGKVKKVGFSLNDPGEIEKLLKNGFIPDLVQVPYNYFDRRFETVILKLKSKGCEIHTRSAFLQGLFFMNPHSLNNYFNSIKPNLIKLQNVDGLGGSLLNFVLKQPFIDKVIIGVENCHQLDQNMNELKYASSLPALDMEISDNILIPSRWPQR